MNMSSRSEHYMKNKHLFFICVTFLLKKLVAVDFPLPNFFTALSKALLLITLTTMKIAYFIVDHFAEKWTTSSTNS